MEDYFEVICNIEECEFCIPVGYCIEENGNESLRNFACHLDENLKFHSTLLPTYCKYKNMDGKLNKLGKKRLMEMNL